MITCLKNWEASPECRRFWNGRDSQQEVLRRATSSRRRGWGFTGNGNGFTYQQHNEVDIDLDDGHPEPICFAADGLNQLHNKMNLAGVRHRSGGLAAETTNPAPPYTAQDR